MTQVQTDILLAILAEMYNELRAYRDKEFQTFLFAFPIIGSGFLSGLTSLSVEVMLSLFGGVVCFYIITNHYRMMRIKATIVSIQDKLEVNNALSALNPKGWKEKPFYKHPGTVVYLLLIVTEVMVLWLFKFHLLN
jgi:hypothetical protein